MTDELYGEAHAVGLTAKAQRVGERLGVGAEERGLAEPPVSLGLQPVRLLLELPDDTVNLPLIRRRGLPLTLSSGSVSSSHAPAPGSSSVLGAPLASSVAVHAAVYVSRFDLYGQACS